MPETPTIRCIKCMSANVRLESGFYHCHDCGHADLNCAVEMPLPPKPPKAKRRKRK